VGSIPPECDDGNACTQDSCDDGSGCINATEPKSGCLTSQRAQLQVRNTGDPTKNQMSWKWQRGQEIQQDAFGTPNTSTSYTLCVYDRDGGTPAIAGSVHVPPSGLYVSKDPKGWTYKDKTGAEDGAFQMSFKPGVDGKSSAQVKSKGANLTAPTPVGATFFHADPGVTVQLHNSEGVCWTSEFNANTLNSGTQFKAKVQ
jgi:hypothetical protein